jgi:hypothetical protein
MDPMLALLVGHSAQTGCAGGDCQAFTLAEARGQKQTNSDDTETEIRQGKFGQQRHRAEAETTQVTTHADECINSLDNQCAPIESMGS